MITLSPRRVLLIVGVPLLMLVFGLAFLLGSGGAPVGPVASPSLLPSPSPVPTKVARADDDQGIARFKQLYPIGEKLPYANNFWRITIAGAPKDGKLPLRVAIRVKPGQDAAALTARQKPFVEKWVAGTGQPAGTYTLLYVTERPELY